MEKDDLIAELVRILQLCYRKFKSIVYYQNNYAYKKESIAEFEADRALFEKTYSDLAKAILEGDQDYFKKLASGIIPRVFPKSIEERKEVPKGKLSPIENTVVQETVTVTDINFFFDGPIEWFILDIFMTLELGANKAGGDYCYANVFHRDAFGSFHEPNYESLYLFKYYFSQYQRWKNDAIVKATDKLNV